MNASQTGLEIVSDSYYHSHQLPVRHADKIICVWMIRDPGTSPAEPLQVAIDQSAIDHMNWRPGDAITLIPVGPDRTRRAGKLIIRKALPGELGFILGAPPSGLVSNGREAISAEVHGAYLSWSFPAIWVESFFPGSYRDDCDEIDVQTERWWKLVEVLDQADQLELVLDYSKLFLYLQRTSSMMTLDLHLIPGLLRLNDWSPSTPLVLESNTDFDPFASEDLLTIRECVLGEEPNLAFIDGRFTAEINPIWLNRFFPDIYDPASVQDPEEGKMLIVPDTQETDSYAERDTLVVGFPDLTYASHSFSFEIRPCGQNLGKAEGFG